MAEVENKTCQSCQTEFAVEPEDFAYYDKIQVPPPTWCPDCRLTRRLLWRNEWHLFKKPDALTGEEIFSAFSPSSAIGITDPSRWYSDSWDPLEYGRDYDFSRPFFEQFRDLLYSVPVLARSVSDIENSDYTINGTSMRNCYLVRAANYTEDSAYLVWDLRSRSTFDCHMTNSCELCYEGLNLSNCYRAFYSVDCEGCRDVILSKDCVGSSNLVGCVNLRNKQYCIFNVQYTKDEYEAKVKELNLGSFRQLTELKAQAVAFWLTQPTRFMDASSNENVSGEYIYESKNAQHVYRVRSTEDSKWTQNVLGGPCRDCYDYVGFGDGAELMYESVSSGKESYNVRFCWYVWPNVRNLQYSMFCQSSSDLFGCVSLRKKQYCILNKQYTKEEYEALVPRIIEHMNEMPYSDAKGRVYRYGEFFPAEFSPVEYNVSPLQEHLPLTKDQALAAGYRWYDWPVRSAAPQLPGQELPDTLQQSDSHLAGQTIDCAHSGTCNEECTSLFTVIPQELAFLIEQGLPLPRLCSNCRHYQRLAARRRMSLVERQCDCQGTQSAVRPGGQYSNSSADHPTHPADQPCPTVFQTSLTPDRPEIVYCEDCYQRELA